ncbi:hypothetical protein KZX59_09470 [Prevotella intermedia]|nr:hypothetical protein [Prevotella intermedia]
MSAMAHGFFVYTEALSYRHRSLLVAGLSEGKTSYPSCSICPFQNRFMAERQL